MKIDFALANSVGPDEMSHYAASLFAKVPNQGFLVHKGSILYLGMGKALKSYQLMN